MIDFYEFSKSIAQVDDPTTLGRTNDWAVTRAKFLSDNKSKRIQKSMIKRGAKQLLFAIQDRAAQANDMSAAFRKFVRQSGAKGSKVSREQFQSVVDNAHDHSFGGKAVTDVFDKLDANGDGFIDFNEFVEGIFSGKLDQSSFGSGRRSGRPNSNPDSRRSRGTNLSGLSITGVGTGRNPAYSPIKSKGSTNDLILGMRTLTRPKTKAKGGLVLALLSGGYIIHTYIHTYTYYIWSAICSAIA